LVIIGLPILYFGNFPEIKELILPNYSKFLKPGFNLKNSNSVHYYMGFLKILMRKCFGDEIISLKR